MIRGIISKALREVWVVIVLCCGALALVMGLFTAILPDLLEGAIEFVAQVPFLRTLISGLMGIDVASGLTPQTWNAVAWTHPVPLVIVWGAAIVLGTRLPAGEIDRGTIDILLGWPVSRRALWLVESALSFTTGAVTLAFGISGALIMAASIPPEQRPDLALLSTIGSNLFALYLAVAGLTFLISSLSDRRGKAIVIVIAILAASFLLNFLAEFSPVAEAIAFLSISHYYKPAQIVLESGFPARNVIVLVMIGVVLWTFGGAIWLRRDIRTI